jgi:excisionase family DNA binding protein
MGKTLSGQTPNYNVRERWPALLSKADAAEYLSCSVAMIERLKARGTLKTVKICERKYLFRRWDLDQYIDQLAYASGSFPGDRDG